MRWHIVGVMLATGCGPRLQTVADVPISSAWLEGFDLSTIAIVGGVVEGDAILGYTTQSGAVGGVPVHLGGGALGVVLDLTGDPEWGSAIPLDLTGADDPVMLSDTLGTYRGTAASFVIGFGIDTRSLQNKRGVRLDENHFALGVGIMAAYEWVKIKEGGSEGSEDTAFVADDSGPYDTGDSAETGDTADTGDTGDSGDSGDSAGSGSGSGDGRPDPLPPADESDDGSGDSCFCCSSMNSAMIVGVGFLLRRARKRRQQGRPDSRAPVA